METLSFESKSKQILEHLQLHKRITSLDAIYKFNATRLAAIIFNLKNDGHSISTEMVYEGRKRYAIYHYAGKDNLNGDIKGN